MKNSISKVFLLLSLCLLSSSLFAQDNREINYSTKYFGPSAFPVPDIHDGRTLSELRIELYNDFYLGYSNSTTYVPSFKVVIPLFSSRVNLTTWMGAYEFYETTPKRLDEVGLDGSKTLKGSGAGDIYISTDIQLLRERKKSFIPDIVLRIALKTASGGLEEHRRYFDCPGYFFDVSIAKSIYFKNSFFEELRFIGSSGFLCWQVGNATQNDAVMYGAKVSLKTKYLSVAAEFGGYMGWIDNGDHPQRIKASLTGHIKKFDLFFQYQYGLQDYPFHMFRLGVAYQLSLHKSR